MWMILLGAVAALIGGATVNTQHPFQDMPENQFELPMTQVGGGVAPLSVRIEPLSEIKFRNIVHQAYDYSCGSAALVTVINNYLGIQVNEQQAMEGMLAFGERDKIIERRGFSLLDMKRYVISLGAEGAGFRASMKDLAELTQPAIVPIDYAGFKHFVVFRGIRGGRVFLADPAMGHIVFSTQEFEELWDRNTLFLLTPGKSQGQKTLSLLAIGDEELGVIDDDLVRRHANLPLPDNSEALRNAVQANFGIFNLRR
ncbi:C39 family peptidase [Paucibacter sp. TC2R-5]|uniref:C39 family peptidase n=1 Tax=Paucibacter sp. TC2R-5 TaxID=2893555 RepID=UPI0021E444CD|nr:C39 family peptidase [Paucibacter sp. TC2R-5]MCV2358099.1 C39 family peptidase [Paucibacter sp. TC2R-5]